jgi:hypothetical protein
METVTLWKPLPAYSGATVPDLHRTSLLCLGQVTLGLTPILFPIQLLTSSIARNRGDVHIEDLDVNRNNNLISLNE